jgi:hypothetical protein
MDQDILFLANPKSTISGLVFNRRVPPAVKVNHMRGCRQVQTSSPRLERKHEKRRPLFLLKIIDHIPAFFNSRFSMQNQAGSAKNTGKKF